MRRLRRSVQVLIATTTLIAGLALAPTAAYATACHINVGGYDGYYVCEYGYPDYFQWPDGHWQYFLVGTDYQIWTNWEINPYSGDFSGWVGLGGQGRSWVTHFNLSWNTVTIEVTGTDGYEWFRSWDRWSGWAGWTSSCPC